MHKNILLQTYIALLRGINVSGHKIIKMEALREALAELQFANVSTYIQSGNILFQSGINNPFILEQQIAGIIEKHFKFQVPVIVVTVKEINAVINNNPYSENEIKDPAQPYVAFLSEIPTTGAVAVLKSVDFSNDSFVHIGKTLYLLYARSAADTKLTNTVIESKLKVRATTRNWKTIQKLIDLAGAMSTNNY